MKRQTLVILFFALFSMTFSGGLCRDDSDCATSPTALALRFVEYCSEKDFAAIQSLLYPGMRSYYEDLDRVFTLNTYLHSTSFSIPRGSLADMVNLRVGRVMTKPEIEESSGDAFFLKLVPPIESDPVECKVRYELDGEEDGLSIFTAEYQGCYYLLVPDVTEIWGIDTIKERLREQGEIEPSNLPKDQKA